jgi:hypothetical protein
MLVLTAGAFGQVTRKGGAYSFRAKYVKGQKTSYDFSTAVTPFGASSSGPARQNLTFPVAMTVQDVRFSQDRKTKVATIKSEVGPWLQNGKVSNPKQTVTVQVDDHNHLVGVGNKEIPQFTVPLPDTPLKVGETWSSDINPQGAVPVAMTVHATYKLISVTRRAATIGVDLEGKGTGQSKITTRGRGTMILRVSDAMLDSMNMVQTVQLAEGMGARTVISVKRRK